MQRLVVSRAVIHIYIYIYIYIYVVRRQRVNCVYVLCQHINNELKKNNNSRSTHTNFTAITLSYINAIHHTTMITAKRRQLSVIIPTYSATGNSLLIIQLGRNM
jgi:hypothetical protein